MKILAIGNSFSTDATAYIEPIASAMQLDLFVRNLFIGGCSLAQHWQNFKTGEQAYEYQKNGEMLSNLSLQEALDAEKWDVVTLQQVSHLSGKFNTYEPYLGWIYAKIRDRLPEVWIVFHQTWAYDIDSDHPGFKNYGRSQWRMQRRIRSATQKITHKYQLPMIPTGEVIRQFRKEPTFNGRHEGIRLTRDGFHLSLTYGRYIAALTWIWFFTGKLASPTDFLPPDANPTVISEILNNFPCF
jgi:hypothetical protein